MLTVKELIKQLKKMPEDLPVKVQSSDSWRDKKVADEVRYEGNHVVIYGDKST